MPNLAWVLTTMPAAIYSFSPSPLNSSSGDSSTFFFATAETLFAICAPEIAASLKAS